MSASGSKETGGQSVQGPPRGSKKDRLGDKPCKKDSSTDLQKQQQRQLQQQEETTTDENNPEGVSRGGHKRKLTLDKVAAMNNSELQVSPCSSPSSSCCCSLSCSDDDWETIDEVSEDEKTAKK